ncbi:MAG: hypothetical protein ACK5P7_06335 [Bdellovibrio sp.]
MQHTLPQNEAPVVTPVSSISAALALGRALVSPLKMRRMIKTAWTAGLANADV